MANQVTVEIKGKQGTGKTTLFNLIVGALKNSGYVGEILPETEFIGEGAHLVAENWKNDIIIVTRPAEKPNPKSPLKKRTYKHWTKKEEGFVAKNYILMSNKELAEALDRSIDSVMVKLTELDLLRPGNFRRLRKKEVPDG